MRVRLSGSGRTGKSEGCLLRVSKYATRGVHSLRAKRTAPRVPRSTSTAPASPKSNGMQRTGRTGTPKISAPTRASEPARIFKDHWGCRRSAPRPGAGTPVQKNNSHGNQSRRPRWQSHAPRNGQQNQKSSEEQNNRFIQKLEKLCRRQHAFL